MPPFIPQKRRRSPSPYDEPSAKRPSLFKTVDELKPSRTLQDNKAFLDQLNASEDESSLSEVDSDEFEDALNPSSPTGREQGDRTTGQGDDDAEDDIDWEDAIDHAAVSTQKKHASAPVSGDLELTLDKTSKTSYLTQTGDKKKGPSKIERQIRISTHCIHVQFLLFHNLIRNGWATNVQVQKTLVGQLPPGVRKPIERWRRDSALDTEQQDAVPRKQGPAVQPRGRKKQTKKNQRDWGHAAARQEQGQPNMTRGDPIIRLLKILGAYWKKRFTITAPSLRKQGYKPISALEEEISSFKKGPVDVEDHGERIEGLEGFLRAAKTCEGSRDVGVQLFTALIRGLGVETRLCASLQPVGFGWSKTEEAVPTKRKKKPRAKTVDGSDDLLSDVNSAIEPGDELQTPKVNSKTTQPSRKKQRSAKGGASKEEPIDLSDDPEKASVISLSGDDEDSLIDVTPATPRRKANADYDRDMPAPTYWVEAASPITHQIYPLDPFASPPGAAHNEDNLAQFEPKGAKADKAKQVLAYVIAYSSDGTAKDVTTRYLKRHVWPGRTKGYRMPVEKIPVYNKKGKIKFHEDFDWFKTVMSGYKRPHALRDAVDDIEDDTDLKPAKPQKKEIVVQKDTLQYYKSSAEFVLERHLRREEALKPGSKPVKTFLSGKGENEKEEPVFRRQDVAACRTGESWHKEGRAVKAGEHPLKLVPVRAVTLNRKREVEEAERDGEKLKQGLYARNQTDWIIPPPIENGIIPKNAYGNMDCFVPTMVPKGAAHVPMRGTVKVCKRLNIDYAEAVTGFEFGNKIAVPVIEGVVIAKGNEAKVIEEWTKDEEERKIKEEGKREKLALATWRKWLMGLRVLQRFREEYTENVDDHVREDLNPFTNKNKRKGNDEVNDIALEKEKTAKSLARDEGEENSLGEDLEVEGGGFLPIGYDEEEPMQHRIAATVDANMSDANHVAAPSGLASLATANGHHPEGEQSSSAWDDDETVPAHPPAQGTRPPKTDNHQKPPAKPQAKAPTKPRQAPRKNQKAKLPTPMDVSDPSDSPSAEESNEENANEDQAEDESECESDSSPPPSPPAKRKGRPTKAIKTVTPKRKVSAAPAARPTPKRAAARRSQTAVRSHYFEQDEDSSNDDDDADDVVQEEQSKSVAANLEGKAKSGRGNRKTM